jgi:hypothetical protein
VSEGRPLDAVQRWFQAVISHPAGVSGGIASEEAQELIRMNREELESVVRRSAQLTAEERLSIYANAYYARLLECLGDVHPQLRRAVGEEGFDALAFAYLQAYPSRSYTLDRLGERFETFLAESRPDLDEEGRPPAEPGWPDFLIELARLERTIGQVFDGPGAEGRPLLSAAELEALGPERFAAARLVPVPCLRLLWFRFPVNAWYTMARHEPEGEAPPPPEPEEEHAALSRRDWIVRRHPLTRPQHALLAAIVEGKTVAEAIGEAAALSGLPDEELGPELRRWFQVWTAEGFFERVG